MSLAEPRLRVHVLSVTVDKQARPSCAIGEAWGCRVDPTHGTKAAPSPLPESLRAPRKVCTARGSRVKLEGLQEHKNKLFISASCKQLRREVTKEKAGVKGMAGRKGAVCLRCKCAFTTSGRLKLERAVYLAGTFHSLCLSSSLCWARPPAAGLSSSSQPSKTQKGDINIT